MSYLIVVVLLALGVAAVLYLASWAVDRNRRAMAAELEDGEQREFSQLLFQQDSVLAFDQAQQAFLMVQRVQKDFLRLVIPYSRLLYSALLHNGKVVSSHTHGDNKLAAYVRQALNRSDDISCCYQVASTSGLRLVGGMQGQTGICIHIPDFETARTWHARFGVLIRNNTDKLAQLRNIEQTPRPPEVTAPAVEPEPVAESVPAVESKPVVEQMPAAVQETAAEQPAEAKASAGVLDNAAAFLRDRLEGLLDEWLEDQTFVIIGERKLRDRLELDISIASFHKLMNSLRQAKALDNYALSFTRKTESWRLSRRKR